MIEPVERCPSSLDGRMSGMKLCGLSLVLLFALASSACGGSEQAPIASQASAAATDSTTSELATTDPVGTPPPAASTPTVSATATPTSVPTPAPTPTPTPVPPADIGSYQWQQVTDDAPWGKRAGLRVLDFDGSLYLLGGRTPRQSTLPGDSDIWADVWRSDDMGQTWEQILTNDASGHWPGRAYFQAVVKDDEMFVIGDQDYGLEPNPFCELLEQGFEPPPSLGIDPDAPCPEFLPTSNFFNDVWSSTDGVNWIERTSAAPWQPRAGLSAVVLNEYIYVLGGSQNDDASIIGPNGPARQYYNDVWRSPDGVEWELMTETASWEPRAGASVTALDNALWLFGGEDGFTCEPLPDCDAPYFNDVWRSLDGAVWELIAPSAGWSERPGHQCEVLRQEFVCFGGFGLVENPRDVWSTSDGVEWTLLADPPWNAEDQTQVKYDFDSITVNNNDSPIIMTFGGDRETFDFADPENYLWVDDDVWVFGPAE